MQELCKSAATRRNGPHLRQLQSFIFLQPTFTLNKIFCFNCRFLFFFPPLLRRRASPRQWGLPDMMLFVSAFLSRYVAGFNVHPLGFVSISTTPQHSPAEQLTELTRAPCLPFPSSSLCSEQVLCSSLPNNLSQPPVAQRKSCVAPSQPKLPPRHEKPQLESEVNCCHHSPPPIKPALPVPACLAACIIHRDLNVQSSPLRLFPLL